MDNVQPEPYVHVTFRWKILLRYHQCTSFLSLQVPINPTSHTFIIYIEVKRPSKQFFSHVGTGPLLPGY